MNNKPDRSMLYIAGSVILLGIAIAVTSFINSRPASQIDIRAKASVESGLVYEGIVSSIDAATGTLSVDSLKPIGSGVTLNGTWTVQVPSGIPSNNMSVGAKVRMTVDSKSLNIQSRTMSVKKINIL